MTAIYDTMQYIRPEIETLCLGQAASVAALLLAAGRHGMRAAVPHARVSISQPRSEVVHGQTSDLSIQAKEIDRLRRLFESALASATAHTAEEIRRDIERETILTAEAARDYGLIDTVLSPRKTFPPSAEQRS
jgi:ATP-dependent Clp protease protease subunit